MKASGIAEKYYGNKALRAFVLSLSLTYFQQLDTKAKLSSVAQMVDTNCANSAMKDMTFSVMMEMKRFEEDDFAHRLKINSGCIAVNAALRENLYCIFVCTMSCVPLMIVGGPGCSKSTACRLICDSFSEQPNQCATDEWLQSFPRVVPFLIHGSERCTATDIERKYKTAQQYSQHSPKVPMVIVDDVGLTDSPNSLLKVIQDLMTADNRGDRMVSFIVISSSAVKLQMGSKFLILKRP
jgi:hypothetical protein